MRVAVIFVSTLLVTELVTAKRRDESCVSPHNEVGTCVSVKDCKSILNAIKTRNSSSLEFARKSQCGYDAEPLVCCEASSRTVRSAKDDVFSNTITICGLDNNVKSIRGNGTELDDFPWLVALEYEEKGSKPKTSFKCGGTVIHGRYILTAAHCIKPDLTRAWIGEWNIATDPDCRNYGELFDCAEPVQKVNILEQIPHPNYNPISNKNDIGLLRLEKDLDFSVYILPICLSRQLPELETSTVLVASGWGITENGKQFDTKHRTEGVFPHPNDVCTETETVSKPLTTNHLCVKGEELDGLCRGDSGGPILRYFYNPEKPDEARWYQEGVISWGVECDRAVYTPISPYLHWIANTIRTSSTIT